MEATEKISAMEAALNGGQAAVKDIFAALGRLKAQEETLRTLFAYYGSKEWFDHRSLDEARALPGDLPRGVLTEDAVYDLLTDLVRLKDEATAVADRLLQGEQETQASDGAPESC